MQLKIEECRECKATQPIVNRKYGLCNGCNRKRLGNTQKTYELKRTPIKKVSSRQREKNKSIAKAYQQMAEELPPKCTGCGTASNLSHSHIIPRSRRSDLVDVVENITYHCLSAGSKIGCHDIWEHGTMDEKRQLRDFDKLMTYIKRTDEEYFYLLFK